MADHRARWRPLVRAAPLGRPRPDASAQHLSHPRDKRSSSASRCGSTYGREVARGPCRHERVGRLRRPHGRVQPVPRREAATTSKGTPGSGHSSKRALTTSKDARPSFPWSTDGRSAPGLTATTWAPAPTRSTVACPVPGPISTTRRPGPRPTSRWRSSNRGAGYPGRARSSSSASSSKISPVRRWTRHQGPPPAKGRRRAAAPERHRRIPSSSRGGGAADLGKARAAGNLGRRVRAPVVRARRRSRRGCSHHPGPGDGARPHRPRPE